MTGKKIALIIVIGAAALIAAAAILLAQRESQPQDGAVFVLARQHTGGANGVL